MTALNAVRFGGQINATTLGAGTIQGASLLTSGYTSTVTLRRESCHSLTIGHNKPNLNKPKDSKLNTKLNTSVLAVTDINENIQSDGEYYFSNFNYQYTLFGFNNAVFITPNGTSTYPVRDWSFPYTFTATNAPIRRMPEIFGDPTTGKLDLVNGLRNYVVDALNYSNKIIRSGSLIIAHWEVNHDGSVNYNEYRNDNEVPTHLQGIYDFSNPAGLHYHSWNPYPQDTALAYARTNRTTIVMGGRIWGFSRPWGVILDGKRGILVQKRGLPTYRFYTSDSNWIPLISRIRAHMNRSNDDVIRGVLPVSLDDPSILYGGYKAIISSYQVRL
jgi:hypothetical protein